MMLNLVNDVRPLAPGVWLAECECGATTRVADSAAGWEWVLTHPCEEGATAQVVDLTERQPSEPC